MEDRQDTRPEIETHSWTYSLDKGLSWPVSSKGKADLVIFDPPYFDKKADCYDKKSISSLPSALVPGLFQQCRKKGYWALQADM